MKTYIALLRGINVGGHNIIKMSELVSELSKQGYQDVKTYIQSGNVIFKSVSASEKTMTQNISQIIKKHFGLDIQIMIRDLDTWKSMSSHHPLMKNGEDNVKDYCVTFLSEAVNSNIELPFETEDRFVLQGSEIFSYYPNGLAKTKLTNTFFEKKLKVFATTRNWRTVNKLLEMAQS
jgi:uncharacterized protein (DUF1697 family)